MRRVRKSPVEVRDISPTAPAVQRVLPLAEPPDKQLPLTIKPATKLWFGIWLPHLPLEACRCSDEALIIVTEQQGIHRVIQADSKATAAGILPGQSANAALALLPTLQIEERSPVREQQMLESVAAWLEQFSSFVSLSGEDVLLLEIAGSLRLFGGLRSLRQKISQGLRMQGFAAAMAIAPTPLAATWLARAGRRVCIRSTGNLKPALRKLTLDCLEWPSSLRETLASMGVSNVGDCLRLPREGFTRRFGAARLLELDRALGSLPDPRDSWRAAERFCADYEMTEEQTDCELLLRICQELLRSHEEFLLARQLGTQRICFSFYHLKEPATELRLGSASADRSALRWFDLLRIRFESVRLPEPVIAVRLRGGLSQALPTETKELCFHSRPRKQRYSIAQLAERLIARLGIQSVNAMTTVAEHRPEYAWRTEHPLSVAPKVVSCTDVIRRKRPLWMLPEPALLPVVSGYPMHEGSRLTLLEGPERLETGWWDENGICRDYYTAVSTAGMQLWVFRSRERLPGWYLHGFFG